MEWKEIMRIGAETLGETAQLVADRVTDKEFREKVVGTIAETSLNLADTAVNTVKKTRHYAQEHYLLPGSKDAYIEQLEAELEAKDREIRILKKKLQKKNWNGRS